MHLIDKIVDEITALGAAIKSRPTERASILTQFCMDRGWTVQDGDQRQWLAQYQDQARNR